MNERAGSQKSADAYRTISEVAEDLILPQHVLRFWETRFPQVKPLKRAGGRRFYRPEDVDLLRAVKSLLYEDGYTIKGVQRMLRDQGPRSLVALAGGVPPRPAPATVAAVVSMPRQDASPPPIDGDSADPVQWPSRLETDAAVAVVADGPQVGGDARGLRPDIVVRLQALLAELAECERVLSSSRL